MEMTGCLLMHWKFRKTHCTHCQSYSCSYERRFIVLGMGPLDSRHCLLRKPVAKHLVCLVGAQPTEVDTYAHWPTIHEGDQRAR
jgi:hypothetical protein